jgi:hypothetical protein
MRPIEDILAEFPLGAMEISGIGLMTTYWLESINT